jgi:hypothetical protein
VRDDGLERGRIDLELGRIELHFRRLLANLREPERLQRADVEFL